MRVVLDTNILISGIFFRGIPGKILILIEKKRVIPCFTPLTFLELKRLLQHEKFGQQRNLLTFSINDFLEKLKEHSLFFSQPVKVPKIIREDPADNYILSCALISQAAFIISGDKHLLKLKEFQGIPILTPKVFLKQFKG